ncbi:MAG: 16S rRNA (guanine(527)-N(7))-methyltransferase RsmG [Nitrospiraceae bacterium]|nr:16S rRNA (guanine(527)-N(7))-methyltransferase RsmG [Nitrospiraceae bacterium]
MEHNLELRKLTFHSIRELGLEITEEQTEQFLRYLNHLVEWNKTVNLTSITDPHEIIIKHFVDSLLALTTTNFSKNCTVLDVGSGGGFPGIPLKIMKPDMKMILIEPVQKKCSFLNSVIGLLKLRDISTFNGTIEQYAKRSDQCSIDTVVIRALKYEQIHEYIQLLLQSKGQAVLYRTELINKEEIGDHFHIVSETFHRLPQESGKRVVTVIEKNT